MNIRCIYCCKPERSASGFATLFFAGNGIEAYLTSLFSRLADDNVGYVDWDPYLPELFNRFFRALRLPGIPSVVGRYVAGPLATREDSIVMCMSSMTCKAVSVSQSVGRFVVVRLFGCCLSSRCGLNMLLEAKIAG